MENNQVLFIALGAAALWAWGRTKAAVNGAVPDIPQRQGGRPRITRKNKKPGVVMDWPDESEFTDAENRYRRRLPVLSY